MNDKCPQKILIMADYAPDAYAWDYATSDCLGPINEYLPANSELSQLDDELSKWCDWFDKSCTFDGGDPNFPWTDFYEQGMALAGRLAVVLKPYGIEIYYQLPYEDPKGKGARPVRVLV